MNKFGFSWERQINTFTAVLGGGFLPASELLQNKDPEQFREEAAGALTVTLPHPQEAVGAFSGRSWRWDIRGIVWHLTPMNQD